MIKKLNNKGITTAEVLVCFVLIVLISASIYSIVDTYSNRHRIESFKEKVVTYKNLLTKEINNDLIKKGLNSAVYNGSDTIEFTLGNGEKKCLKFIKTEFSPNVLDYDEDEGYQGNVSCVDVCSGNKESFAVGYGACGNEIMYPLPDLGFSYNENDDMIYDLRIKSFDFSNYDNILSLDIRFYHPELGSKYGINIVNPIGFSL